MADEATQLSAEELEGMGPEQIVEALAAGRLNDYLASGRGEEDGASPIDGKTAEQIMEMLQGGELDDYLAASTQRRGSVS